MISRPLCFVVPFLLLGPAGVGISLMGLLLLLLIVLLDIRGLARWVLLLGCGESASLVDLLEKGEQGREVERKTNDSGCNVESFRPSFARRLPLLW